MSLPRPSPLVPRALCLLALVATAAAADGWDVWGDARLRAVGATDFPVDDRGAPADQTSWYASRVLAGLRYSPLAVLELHVELEGLSGRFAGDLPAHGARVEDAFRHPRDQRFGVTTFRPRQAYLQLATPAGVFRLGQQAFLWGTGMLAHDGRTAPDFGDAWQGNLVERALYLGRPVRKLYVFVGADLVFADDNAELLEGDTAWAGVAGVRWDDRALELGLLESVRFQTDRDDPLRPDGERTTLRVAVTDVYARVALPWEFELEGEAALVAGRTTRPYFEDALDGADVLAFGGVARLAWERGGLYAKLEYGHASGDNDPRDDTARPFSFNTDYGVGLLLFDHVLPLVTARAADRINDPELLDVAPSGLRFTVNQGAVGNAEYLYPFVRWEGSGVDLRLGYLYARSAGDLVDVYRSGLNGGFNTTPGGATPGSRELGQEILAAASYTFDLGVALRLGAEAAVFLPGDALAGAVEDPLWLGRGKVDLSW